jgi:p-aminobenzoyl-glutamate transporter AbgT
MEWVLLILASIVIGGFLTYLIIKPRLQDVQTYNADIARENEEIARKNEEL